MLFSGFCFVFELCVGVSGKDSVGFYFKMLDFVDFEDWVEIMDSKDEEVLLDSFYFVEYW